MVDNGEQLDAHYNLCAEGAGEAQQFINNGKIFEKVTTTR